jgi:hypothetical protein
MNRTGGCDRLIESVYSMDGDVAPSVPCWTGYHQFGAQVIVTKLTDCGIYGNTNNNKNDSKITVVVYYIYTRWQSIGGRAGRTTSRIGLFDHTFGRRRDVTERWFVVVPYSVTWSTTDILSFTRRLCRCILAVIRCSYDTMTGSKGDRLRESVFQPSTCFG